MTTSPPVLTPTQIRRFWTLVDRGDGAGCFLWTGTRRPKTRGGYGLFAVGSTRKGNHRVMGAHRVALFLANGEWREQGCHKCGNPPCVRVGPGHLYWGDRLTNAADMVAHGNSNPGQKNPHARLTADQVARIRAEVASGPWGTQRRMAREYGVTDAAISLIVNGVTWVAA